MCDYSLNEYQSRLAIEGESLVVHRFPSGSIGLISREQWEDEPQDYARGYYCAVCVPHGTRVSLDRGWWLKARKGTVIQMQLEGYRDAIRFDNGAIISFQELERGRLVKVVSMTPAEEREEPVDVPLPVEQRVLGAVPRTSAEAVNNWLT